MYSSPQPSLQATAKQPYWIHGHFTASCWHELLNISELLACWSSVWKREGRLSSKVSSRRTTVSSVSIMETWETSALNSKTAACRSHCWGLVVPGLPMWFALCFCTYSLKPFFLLLSSRLPPLVPFYPPLCQCTVSSAACHCTKLTFPYLTPVGYTLSRWHSLCNPSSSYSGVFH